MPHTNNKQDKNRNLIISRQDYHLTQPCPSEGKKKKTQQLTSSHQSVNTNHTLCGAYTKHWTNLIRVETNRKKEFDYEAWEKEALTISFKILIIKRQKYCTKEQPRDTEVQINEEEIGKLPGKEFRIIKQR